MAGMTKAEIDKAVKSIRETTERLIKAGPAACRKFLIDAGIIKPRKRKK